MSAMTDQQAIAESAKHPHLSAEYFAYYAGRNAVWNNRPKCGFTRPALKEEFRRGFRHACTEERLSNDFEWDDIAV